MACGQAGNGGKPASGKLTVSTAAALTLASLLAGWSSAATATAAATAAPPPSLSCGTASGPANASVTSPGWQPALPVAADAPASSAPYYVTPRGGAVSVVKGFTGQTVATVATPDRTPIDGIAAARDDRTFVLYTSRRSAGTWAGRATAGRASGPILLNSRGARMDRHAATRRLRQVPVRSQRQ